MSTPDSLSVSYLPPGLYKARMGGRHTLGGSGCSHLYVSRRLVDTLPHQGEGINQHFGGAEGLSRHGVQREQDKSALTPT